MSLYSEPDAVPVKITTQETHITETHHEYIKSSLHCPNCGNLEVFKEMGELTHESTFVCKHCTSYFFLTLMKKPAPDSVIMQIVEALR